MEGQIYGRSHRPKRLTGDIRLWLLPFFLVRLIGINAPPIEIGHSWRQCLTAMIARNLVEISPDLRFPRVDMGGTGTGIIGAEFPVLNGLMALLHVAFGPGFWQGRSIVLVASGFAAFSFHDLVRRRLGGRVALASTLVLLSSSWFMFSRKIMPDVFSCSLVLIALAQAFRYVVDGRPRRLAIFLLLATLGLLSKLPAACLLGLLAWPVLDRRLAWPRRQHLLMAASVALMAACLWYFLWVPHLVEAYGYPLYYPRSLRTGLHELWLARLPLLEKFVFQALSSYLAFAACLSGSVLLVRKGGRKLVPVALAVLAPFFYFMVKAGEVFAVHSYYILPLVPVMAVLAGVALARIPGRWFAPAVLAVCAEGVANQAYDLFTPDRTRFLLKLESIADRYTSPRDLVVVNGGLDPQRMYFLHRRGWSLTDDECRDAGRLKELAGQGAAYLFLVEAEPPAIPGFRLLHHDDHVAVLGLPRPQQGGPPPAGQAPLAH